MEGQTLSHYRVLERLGGGGMGVVYKALDMRLDRHVALKFLPPELTRDDEARLRFIHEAKAASALDHPNICTIHEIDVTPQDQQFIAMAYYEGETLSKRLQRGPLPLDQAVDVAIQIALGLVEAHAAGIVHRDIKPANVMLTKNGQVKIVDFGIAKLSGITGQTRTGNTLGTVSYMSPEQIAGQPAGQQSDVWSLGAVFYEMLTGQQPFRGEHQWAVMSAINEHEPERPSAIRAEIPADVERLVLKALQKDRTLRHKSATEFVTEAKTAHAALTKLVEIPPATTAGWRPRLTGRAALAALVGIAIVAGSALWWWNRSAGPRWARNEAVPEILRLIEQDRYGAAFRLAEQAEQYIANDPVLADLWRQISATQTFVTKPPGVEVFVRPYDDRNGDWRRLGQTPVNDGRVPQGLLQFRLERDGYETLDRMQYAQLSTPTGTPPRLELQMPSGGTVTKGMVQIPARRVALHLSGFNYQESVSAPAYEIDKYEVTNREFKAFVEAGGYDNEKFWTHPFVSDGRPVSWGEAMTRFRDATGRPGPSTWQGGTYREGQEAFPVTGVSWYEAAAFAEFVGKSLPTVYHWASVSAGQLGTMASSIIAQSNFGGEGLHAVGGGGMSPFGTYDMAGNAREWTFNQVGESNDRYILGGAWSDPSYKFVEVAALAPFDRSDLNGFRTVRYNNLEAIAGLLRPINTPSRDFSRQLIASNEIFEVYRNSYTYDRTALNPIIEATDNSSRYWIRERITLNAPYGRERFAVYLFLPKNVKPPYQTIVFWPGANAISTPSFDNTPEAPFDYLIMSGRAVAFPVYDETFERNRSRVISYPDGTSSYRDWSIRTSKDFMRTVDYLETRPEIGGSPLAFLGISWGGRMGPIVMALDKRIKTGVLIVGGLTLARPFAEVDPFHFAPRVTAPVLMLNGDDDIVFPVAAAQKPLFDLLGTPAQQKKWVKYDGGHAIGATHRNQVVSQVLDWLNKVLGPVR